jgi:hypothetical protein
MADFFLHAGLGFALSLGVFLLFMRLSGETSTSLPTAPVLVGLLCGIGAVQLSPWATVVIVLLYAVTGWGEWRQGEQARRRPGGSAPDEPGR